MAERSGNRDVSGTWRLAQIVELAHRHVGLDAAVAVEVRDGCLEVQEVAGDAGSFGLSAGDELPVEGTYCEQVLGGVIPDATADGRVAGLLATRRFAVGAYVGVPLRLDDGSRYGVLCCLAHQPAPALDGSDARCLDLLADLLVGELTERRRRAEQRETLTRLIAGEDLQIACQPVIDLRDETVIGLEALSRFTAPLGPEEAFAVAHDVGLGLELERLAIRRAVTLLPRLAPGQFLSVNVSPDVAMTLARQARGLEGLPLGQLVMELTEHAVVDSYPTLRAQLAELRDQGLRLAVDDAGAGYASLRHVVELRPEFIKIDRSLVDGVAADRARRIAVSSFVLLALDLGSTIVAEGVETSDDLAALLDLGVDAAQGYLLAQPSTDPRQLDAWTAPAQIRSSVASSGRPAK